MPVSIQNEKTNGTFALTPREHWPQNPKMERQNLQVPSKNYVESASSKGNNGHSSFSNVNENKISMVKMMKMNNGLSSLKHNLIET